MRRALVWLNLYGHEAVRCKLKNSLKTQKMHFLPVFEANEIFERCGHYCRSQFSPLFFFLCGFQLKMSVSTTLFAGQKLGKIQLGAFVLISVQYLYKCSRMQQ